ncbi:purine-nucleoside phosphorylase [Myxococcota bacterium]|nr:purine-nucleoside phosphorylase [Myxococcota bacterium]MBU1380119.1 purine-nucleoside phosphorylase [Myxococcota bacterium]MBU1497143.1 purine-nucleoside phosphorylase [Myxococcota bacterium]
MTDIYNNLKKTADYISQKTNGLKPEIGLILGSGLGDFADSVEGAFRIPYSEIPGFAVSTVSGHAGMLVAGQIEGKTVAIMQGRIHYYEGHSMENIIFPARALVMLGCKTLIITNAAGGITHLSPGDLCLISDHINFMGANPLRGENDERLGPRFPDMSDIYSKELRKTVKEIAHRNGILLKEGIYAAMPGPTYESPAEINMLKVAGASMVGMSTVPESIAAHHMGASIIGISCISNLAAGISPVPLTHEEVKETASRISDIFKKLIREIITGI